MTPTHTTTHTGTAQMTAQTTATPSELPINPADQTGRLFPSAADRSAWDANLARLSPVLRDEIDAAVGQAKVYKHRPILASHYRIYMDKGERVEFYDILQSRREALLFLGIGEGVLDDQACLGPLEDLIWATCEETTWVTPPVARGLPSHLPADFVVELTPAMTGLLLASIDHLLEEQLDVRVRERMNQCLLERVIRPFLDKDYWWLNPSQGRRLNNWTAVCFAGVLACVTLVPELKGYRQQVIDRALEPFLRYLETFDEQGCCEEGGSYWVFGMDYFTLAVELLNLDPSGPDLYTLERIHERLKAVAQFPSRIFLGDKQWMTYSDCRQTPRINPASLARLGEKLDVSQAIHLASRCETHLAFLAKEATLIHSLAWWPQRHDTVADSVQQAPTDDEPCVYFTGVQWMISRVDPTDPNTLVLSAHGGHNGVSHNHNDTGHVSVYHQTLPLLVDLGVPVYDRDYFSPKRTDYFVASSLSHSVPQINGQLQLRGEAYTSHILKQSHNPKRDELVMTLHDAYGPEAGIESLKRTIVLDRQADRQPDDLSAGDAKNLGRVEVMDEFTFKADSPDRWQFVSAAITTGKITQLGPGQLLIENGPARGVLKFDATEYVHALEVHTGVVLSEATVDCTRICLSLRKPAKAGHLVWSITPIKSGA